MSVRSSFDVRRSSVPTDEVLVAVLASASIGLGTGLLAWIAVLMWSCLSV